MNQAAAISPRILIVDDELGMREGCRRALAGQGYQAEVAADGEEGWQRIQTGSWDLILVDIRMPGINGIELLERIHNLDPEIVCLVITGYATLETAIQATKRGAYDILPKPFTADDLLLAVRRGLEHRFLILDARRLQEERGRDLMLLVEEQSRLRTVLDCLADGVLVANREGRLALFNPAALHLLGLRETPPVGAPIADILCGSTGADWTALEPARDGQAVTMTRELTCFEHTLLASIAPVVDRQGNRMGTVALLRDISAAKALDQLKDQFISMTSHELRAPLSAVQTYLDTLLGGFVGDLSEEQRVILDRCSQRLGALVSLVNDLLDTSRLQGGRAERRIVTLAIAPVIQDALEMLRSRAEERQLSLSTEIAPDLPAIDIDREDLTRILTNLLDNAIKYNHPGGSITVRARGEGYYVRLEVADTGMGIPKDALPQLFSEFFRVKRPETVGITGTGLGLSIVKRIVEFYKGHVEVESELGAGSTFSVFLPCAECKSAG
jgi:two-component system phosphate regulon sensor histidine kinase PhoR